MTPQNLAYNKKSSDYISYRFSVIFRARYNNVSILTRKISIPCSATGDAFRWMLWSHFESAKALFPLMELDGYS